MRRNNRQQLVIGLLLTGLLLWLCFPVSRENPLLPDSEPTLPVLPGKPALAENTILDYTFEQKHWCFWDDPEQQAFQFQYLDNLPRNGVTWEWRGITPAGASSFKLSGKP